MSVAGIESVEAVDGRPEATRIAIFETLRRWFDPWSALFFLACFGYAFLWIDPTLQYHALSPVFFGSQRFFHEHLTYPGGLVEWAAALVLQCYRISLLGALITTLIAAMFVAAARFLMAQGGWPRARVLPFLPVVLLLMVQSHYSYSWMAPTLAMLVAAGFAAGYAALPTDRWPVRAAAIWLAALPLYWLLGGVYLLFAGLCALADCRKRERRWQGLLSVAAGLLIPWLAAHLLVAISYRDAYGFLVPLLNVSKAPLAMKVLFVCLPCLSLVALCGKLFGRQSAEVSVGMAALSKSPGNKAEAHPPMKEGAAGRVPSSAADSRKRHSTKTLPSRGKWGRLNWLGHPGLWMVLAALLVGFTIPPQAKTLARIEHCAQRKDWQGVLAAGSRLRVAEPAAVSDINRALCHSGRLLDEMFRYPQQRGLALWLNLDQSVDLDRLWKGSELLFELGHVNRSERLAGEALELSGYRPAILQRLFYINVLKGYPETALPYLNLLEQTVWHRGWAERYRRALEADPKLTNDPELQQARTVMITQDYIGSIPNNVLMQASLRQNRRNQMAFQYLIATYLLDGEIEKILQNFPRLDELGIRDLPRHVQEAVLIHQELKPQTEVDLRGRKLDPAILERNRRFREEVKRSGAGGDQGETRLAAEYGDTYWYYFVYGHSGSVRPAPPARN